MCEQYLGYKQKLIFFNNVQFCDVCVKRDEHLKWGVHRNCLETDEVAQQNTGLEKIFYYFYRLIC